MMGKWEPNWVTAKLIALVAVSLSIFQMWQPIAGFIPAGAIPFEDIFGMQPLADTPINGFVIKQAIKPCSLATCAQICL